MSDNNVELFNEHAALIFSELYRKFPLPSHIEYRIVALGKDPHDCSHLEDTGRTPLEERVYNATVKWLADAGYITLDGSPYEGNAILTSKGLETMKAVPGSLDSPEPMGEQLVTATKSGARTAAADLVAKGLTHGFWMLMKGHSL